MYHGNIQNNNIISTLFKIKAYTTKKIKIQQYTPILCKDEIYISWFIIIVSFLCIKNLYRCKILGEQCIIQKSCQIRNTACTSSQIRYTDCTSNQILYSDCTSSQVCDTDYTSSQVHDTVCTNQIPIKQGKMHGEIHINFCMTF